MSDFLSKTQEIKAKNSTNNILENALYVVATPIGNLLDITLRALDVLQKSDVIICEDTRVSNKLLSSHQIFKKKLITYNDHSSDLDRKKILDYLQNGKSIALISDAGTPLISDPGYKLIRFLHEFNKKVIPVPGASSLTSAISVSGLSCNNFLFLGFLPNSKLQKEKLFKSLPKEYSFAFFEAPNRVVETLSLAKKVLGNRKAALAKEITKIHEEIISNDLEGLIGFFEENKNKLKGEFVIIVEKADKLEKSLSEEDLLKEISKAVDAGLSLKDLSQNLSDIYGINRKEIYQLALSITKK